MRFLNALHIQLANPEMLWLLLLLPLLIWYAVKYKAKRKATLRLSTIEQIRKTPRSLKARLRPLMLVLECIAFVAIVIALSRPQQTNTTENINSKGINIVLCMDISGSMLSEDFKPNRIEAAKKIAVQFVKERPADRIGLVVFAGESYTQCPLTIDHNVLIEQLEKIHSGMLVDGTAIGMGLGTAVDRLRHAEGKSKVVILMTDGVNNTGKIDPQTALELAKAYQIKVYTIGVGTEGEALFPVQTPMGIQKQMLPVQIDEPLLKQIATQTGGQYFRATNNKKLADIYHTIDQLEKTKIKVNAFKEYKDLFFPFVFIALGALVLSLILRLTWFKSIT